MRNGLFWFLAGPGVLLIAAAAYAVALQLAILFDKQQSLLSFLDRTVQRMESGKRAGSILWGCAIIVALLAGSAVLINIKPLALLAIVLVVSLLILLGLASAASAQFIEHRLTNRQLSEESPSPQPWPPNGWKTLFFAAAFPIIGWLCGAAFISASLGAIGELTVARFARRA